MPHLNGKLGAQRIWNSNKGKWSHLVTVSMGVRTSSALNLG